MYNENRERSKTMKRLAVILSVIIFSMVFLTSCAMIDQRYTGKRIQVAPGDYEYRDNDYALRGDYYDPYYSYYDDPFFWTGLSFWNPFWHYGFINYWSFGYYPYYGGYYPSYWGYYPSFWGGSNYYPIWGMGYYPSYRTNYRYMIRKNQLSRTGSYRVPSVRTRSVSGKKSTSIKSRPLAPSSRTSSVRTRTSSSTRTSSRTTIKKKK
jgi:hypothetical protein